MVQLQQGGGILIDRPTYMKKIIPHIDTPFVKILTGVRRCGKSTLLKMIIEELGKRGIDKDNILHYNFDSLQYDEIKTSKKLYDVIGERLSKTGRSYLFFDEIQEVQSWERVINSLMTDFDVDIYVTGSNSHMMSSEISTYLTGRYITFRVYPLSFAEYLEFKNQYTEVSTPHLELPLYLKQGGFPAVHLKEYTQDEIYSIVKDIYNSTIFTDIIKRNGIRKVDQLERIVKFSFGNVGKTFSATSISKYLKNENRAINNETVYNYLSKLEGAYILHRCSRFDLEGKEILKTQEKFYLADSAFKYSVLGYTPDSIAAMLENIVYLELLRRGYEVYVGKLKATEIDFVAMKQEERIYIQVTRMIEKEETHQREYSRLLAIKDNYPKYLLRTDEFADGNYQGIKTMHIADFLLLDRY